MQVALHESARIVRDGRDFTLRIRHLKTGQQGAGTDVPVKWAAADALRRWLRLLADQGITDGPLFEGSAMGVS